MHSLRRRPSRRPRGAGAGKTLCGLLVISTIVSADGGVPPEALVGVASLPPFCLWAFMPRDRSGTDNFPLDQRCRCACCHQRGCPVDEPSRLVCKLEPYDSMASRHVGFRHTRCLFASRVPLPPLKGSGTRSLSAVGRALAQRQQCSGCDVLTNMPTVAAPALTSRHGVFACGSHLRDAAAPRDGALPRGTRVAVVTVQAAKGKKGGAGSGGSSGGSGGGSGGGGGGGGGGKFKSPGEVKEGAAYSQETRCVSDGADSTPFSCSLSLLYVCATPRKTILTMNRLNKVTPSGKQLLKGVSLGIYLGAKIGILGANGAGKSTLMKILAGSDTAFDGDVSVQKGLRIGYLPQEPQLDAGDTVWSNIEPALADMKAKLAEFEAVSADMANPDADMDALMGKMERLQAEIDAANGWEIDRTAERAMDALRCPPGDYLVKNLSGGERRRVAICRLLLSNPQMLLLDEVRSLVSLSSHAHALTPPSVSNSRPTI